MAATVLWVGHRRVFCVLVIYGITVSEQYAVELPGLPYFRGYFINPVASFLIFLCTELTSACVNCPSLMSC